MHFLSPSPWWKTREENLQSRTESSVLKEVGISLCLWWDLSLSVSSPRRNWRVGNPVSPPRRTYGRLSPWEERQWDISAHREELEFSLLPPVGRADRNLYFPGGESRQKPLLPRWGENRRNLKVVRRQAFGKNWRFSPPPGGTWKNFPLLPPWERIETTVLSPWERIEDRCSPPWERDPSSISPQGGHVPINLLPLGRERQKPLNSYGDQCWGRIGVFTFLSPRRDIVFIILSPGGDKRVILFPPQWEKDSGTYPPQGEEDWKSFSPPGDRDSRPSPPEGTRELVYSPSRGEEQGKTFKSHSHSSPRWGENDRNLQTHTETSVGEELEFSLLPLVEDEREENLQSRTESSVLKELEFSLFLCLVGRLSLPLKQTRVRPQKRLNSYGEQCFWRKLEFSLLHLGDRRRIAFFISFPWWKTRERKTFKVVRRAVFWRKLEFHCLFTQGTPISLGQSQSSLV